MDNVYKTSEAHRKAVKKYNANKTDQILLRVPKGQKLEIQSYAEYRGMSVNALIYELLQKEMNSYGNY